MRNDNRDQEMIQVWRAAPPVLLAPQTLGEALRLLSNRAGCTVEGLAELSGVSRSSVGAYLGDERSPSAPKLQMLVDALAENLHYEVEALTTEVNRLVRDIERVAVLAEDGPPWFTFKLGRTLSLLGVETSWEACPSCEAHLRVEMPLSLLNEKPRMLEEQQRVLWAHGLHAEVSVTPDAVVRTYWPADLHAGNGAEEDVTTLSVVRDDLPETSTLNEE